MIAWAEGGSGQPKMRYRQVKFRNRREGVVGGTVGSLRYTPHATSGLMGFGLAAPVNTPA